MTWGGGEVADGGGVAFLDDGVEALVDGDDSGAALQLRGVKGSEDLAEMGDGKNRSSELTLRVVAMVGPNSVVATVLRLTGSGREVRGRWSEDLHNAWRWKAHGGKR
jgi:uncharacterized alpha-E superfamily protein